MVSIDNNIKASDYAKKTTAKTINPAWSRRGNCVSLGDIARYTGFHLTRVRKLAAVLGYLRVGVDDENKRQRSYGLLNRAEAKEMLRCIRLRQSRKYQRNSKGRRDAGLL